MKAYPLQPRSLWEARHGPYGAYSKGHHAPDAFLAACREGGWDDVVEHASPAMVLHLWWRFVPDNDSGGSVSVDAAPHARGAFPVTVFDLERLPREER
jgi:hypothetical protein